MLYLIQAGGKIREENTNRPPIWTTFSALASWNFQKHTIQGNCLQSCHFGYHSISPAALKSSEDAFYWLLWKHRSNTPLLLIIPFSFLTVNHFVKPACTRVSHFWRVTAQDAMSKWSKDRGGANVFCQTSIETFRSDPPHCSSFISSTR
jgi:hypothetical protein